MSNIGNSDTMITNLINSLHKANRELYNIEAYVSMRAAVQNDAPIDSKSFTKLINCLYDIVGVGISTTALCATLNERTKFLEKQLADKNIPKLNYAQIQKNLAAQMATKLPSASKLNNF